MDEATLELVRQGFRNDGDEVIGYRRITEQITDAPCQDGCLAPGSSLHFHTRTVAWEIIGSKSILTVNTEGMSIRHSSVHPIDEFVQRELTS